MILNNFVQFSKKQTNYINKDSRIQQKKGKKDYKFYKIGSLG